LLLGTGVPTLSCNGNGSIDVNGQLALNGTLDGGGNISGTSTVTASSFYTANQNHPEGTLVKSGLASYNPPGTPISGSAIEDPYRSLVPPNPAGMPTYSGGNYQGPGIYTSPLSFAGNNHIDFESGIYILQQGISLSGNASISSQPGGVFIYLTGGQLEMSGNGSIDLSPLSSPPSPAENLVIWQPSSNTNPILITGNGNQASLGGTIYAPAANLNMSGNGQLSAGAVVSASLSCSGNGKINVG
jgi:hypothetical protein